MNSPLASDRGGGSRRRRYSRSPSNGPKRSKLSSSVDGGHGSDQHRLYTSICVKNINPKIPDLEVRELCNRKFSKYGSNAVKIYYKNQERVAFVNFTNCEDAKKARHAKTGLVWENIQVALEPVYYRRTVPAEQPLNPESPRARSPPSPRRRPRRPSPSPPPPRSSRHNPPSPPPRSRRHYSPYIPLPPELVGYTSTKSSRYQPSPPVSPPPARSRQRRSRSRSKVDDSAASRVDSNVQHEPTRTLFVGNLEREVRESKLKELFGRYGTIEEIDLKVPQSSSKRAYAFIQYENMDMAYEARRAMDGHFIGKADCKIGYGKIVPTSCLWVGNISMDIRQHDLKKAFARYGAIKSFDYETGDPTAIVTYVEIEDAIKARAKMVGVIQLTDGRKVRAESEQSDPARRAGFRIDYLDRPTVRRFVIVRPQDTTVTGRGSRSPSASPVSSNRARSPKTRARSISDEELPSRTTSKRARRDSRSLTPPATPIAGRTVHGPFGAYLSSSDTASVHDVNDLMALCEQLNVSASRMSTSAATVYPVQFFLKSQAYNARMHFLAGNPKLVNSILGQPGDHTSDRTELKVTQRLRLDQHKLDDLERKLRASVSSSSSSRKTTTASHMKFALLITSPKTVNPNDDSHASSTQRKSNGRSHSSGHRASSQDEEDEEASLSPFISYLSSKEAAGVITIPFPADSNDDSAGQDDAAVLHIFPPCPFSKKVLKAICPSIDFSNGPQTPPSRATTTLNDEHLMVAITYSE